MFRCREQFCDEPSYHSSEVRGGADSVQRGDSWQHLPSAGLLFLSGRHSSGSGAE